VYIILDICVIFQSFLHCQFSRARCMYFSIDPRKQDAESKSANIHVHCSVRRVKFKWLYPNIWGDGGAGLQVRIMDKNLKQLCRYSMHMPGSDTENPVRCNHSDWVEPFKYSNDLQLLLTRKAFHESQVGVLSRHNLGIFVNKTSVVIQKSSCTN
jgi:hypothetical protein